MIVVSDTSPIRALHFLGLLPILRELYGQVEVPIGVQEELLVLQDPLERIDLSRCDFIRVGVPRNQSHVSDFLQTLDRGESESLALALDHEADLILIDELAGRHTARNVRLRPLGTLGVLLEAKTNGLVPTVRLLMQRLTAELGFFVSEGLQQQILEIAGE